MLVTLSHFNDLYGSGKAEETLFFAPGVYVRALTDMIQNTNEDKIL